MVPITKSLIAITLFTFVLLFMPVVSNAEDQLLLTALAQELKSWEKNVKQGHGSSECYATFHETVLEYTQPTEIIANWEQIKRTAKLCEHDHDLLGKGMVWTGIYVKLSADGKSEILNRPYLLEAIINMDVLRNVDTLDPRLAASLTALSTEIAHNSQRFAQVITLADNAEAAFNRLGVDKSLSLALAISNKGYAESKQGHLQTGATELLRAERMLRKLDRLDEAQLAVIYRRLASIYNDLNQPRQAIDYNEKAKQLFNKFGSKIDSANLCFNKGTIFLNAGLYDPAIDEFTQARNTFLELNIKKELGLSMYNLGKAWYQKNYRDRALNFYEQAEQFLNEAHAYKNIAQVYVSMGILYENQFTEAGYQQARQYYDNAEKLLAEQGALSDEAHFILAINRGRLYERWGDYQQANAQYLKAEKYVPKARSQERCVVYNNLAFLAMLRKEYDSALAYSQQALKDIDETLALQFSITGASNLDFVDKNLSAYSIAIESLIHKGEVIKAYAFREAFRNRGFQYMVRMRDEKKVDHHFDTLWQKKLELDKRISELDQRAVQILSDNERRGMLSQRHALEKERESVEREFFSNPEQYRKIFGSGSLNVQLLQADLHEDEALIDFQVTAKLLANEKRYQIAAFVVKRDGIKYIDLFPGLDAHPNLELIKKYNDLHRPQSLQHYYSNNTLPIYTQKVLSESKALYHDLFAKLASELTGVKKLFIIPDGALNLLPFETLRDDQGCLLLNRYSISYLNSPADIYRSSQKTNNDLLVFGDIDYGTVVEGYRHWRKIQGSADVLTVVNNSMQGQLSLTYVHDNEATETLFNRLAPGNKILLIWTHGEFSEYSQLPAILSKTQDEEGGMTFTNPEELDAWHTHLYQRQFNDPLSNSFLALAGINQGGDGTNNGYLTAREVMGLDLDGTQLTILAACETGIGQTSPSEGVLGLRKAFLIAGSQQLLVSLWQVDAKWTGELVKNMLINYEELGGARALQNAKQQVIKQLRTEGLEPYPFYWAGFVLVGKDHLR
jgi:CHAT domain-containing protein